LPPTMCAINLISTHVHLFSYKFVLFIKPRITLHSRSIYPHKCMYIYQLNVHVNLKMLVNAWKCFSFISIFVCKVIYPPSEIHCAFMWNKWGDMIINLLENHTICFTH
jgi:hypothetical protein